MWKVVTTGFRVLTSPKRGWREVRDLELEAFHLLSYVALLGSMAVISRFVGGGLATGNFGAALADAILFVSILVVAAGIASVVIDVVLRRLGELSRPLSVQAIMVFSLTPVFVVSPLFLIPAPELWWPYVLLGGLGWGAFHVLRGLWALTLLDGRGVLVAALSGSFVWILGASVLTQVVWLVLMSK